MADLDQNLNPDNSSEEDELYKIETCENFGRYLISRSMIPQRTLILDEHPLIYAPTDNDDGEMCLGCCNQLESCKNDNDKGFSCPHCHWPMCSSCTGTTMMNSLHEEYECKIFRLNQVKYPAPNKQLLYKSILVLRILLMIKKDPKLWKDFFQLLEHHNDLRNTKERCIKADAQILENLNYFNCNHHNAVFDRDMTKQIIGIINVNAFGATKGKNMKKCIFRKASIFAHSCAPNCTWKISNTGIQVYSSIQINEGDLLTIPYNTRHLFFGTLKRQILIESVAHFICKCSRCKDPTEHGTYMSSLRCFKCDKGFLIPQNTEFQDSDWICTLNECHTLEPVSKIVFFISEIEDFFDKIVNADLSLNKEIQLLQKLFDKHYGVLLHENHYTLQEISTRILELLVEHLEEEEGKIDGANGILELFLWHCKYLKKVADVILPGYNGYQEQLQDYLTEGIFHLNNRNLEVLSGF